MLTQQLHLNQQIAQCQAEIAQCHHQRRTLERQLLASLANPTVNAGWNLGWWLVGRGHNTCNATADAALASDPRHRLVRGRLPDDAT